MIGVRRVFACSLLLGLLILSLPGSVLAQASLGGVTVLEEFTSTSDQSEIRSVNKGNEFMVAWQELRGGSGTQFVILKIDTGGTVLARTEVIVESAELDDNFDIVYEAAYDNAVLVYVSETTGSYRVEAVAIDWETLAADRLVISESAYPINGAAVAADRGISKSMLVVWKRSVDLTSQLLGVVLTPKLQILSSPRKFGADYEIGREDIFQGAHRDSGVIGQPSAAHNPLTDEYLILYPVVIYADGYKYEDEYLTGIYAARANDKGKLQAFIQIAQDTILASHGDVAVAYTYSAYDGFLAAWKTKWVGVKSATTGYDLTDINGVRINNAAERVGAPINYSDVSDNDNPRISAGSWYGLPFASFLVTWTTLDESGNEAAWGRAIMADEESDAFEIVPASIQPNMARRINSISGYEKGFMVFYAYEYEANGQNHKSFRCRTVDVP